MPIITRLSKKNQIVIPKSIRNQLGIKEGDELIIELVDGLLRIVERPVNYTKKLRGLHRKVWGKIETESYLNKERDSW